MNPLKAINRFWHRVTDPIIDWMMTPLGRVLLIGSVVFLVILNDSRNIRAVTKLWDTQLLPRLDQAAPWVVSLIS